MTEGRIIIALIFLYCAMTAFTHGYVMDRNNCYINPSEYADRCSEEPMAKATIWPLYWIYHSGTLLFEPDNTD